MRVTAHFGRVRSALLFALLGAVTLTALAGTAATAAASPGSAYVTNLGSNSVTPIEVATNKAGSEITVGEFPIGIAITPDGKTAYVTNFGEAGTVTPIELATNKAGAEITVAAGRSRWRSSGRQDRLRHQRRSALGDADRSGDEQSRRGNHVGAATARAIIPDGKA